MQGHTFFWTCPNCNTGNRNDLHGSQYQVIKRLVPRQCAYDDEFVKCGAPITLDDVIEFAILIEDEEIDVWDIFELEGKIG